MIIRSPSRALSQLADQAERIRLSWLLLGRLRTRLAREHPGEFAGWSRWTLTSPAGSHVLLAIGKALLLGEPLATASDHLQGLEQLARDLRDWEPPAATAGGAGAGPPQTDGRAYGAITCRPGYRLPPQSGGA